MSLTSLLCICLLVVCTIDAARLDDKSVAKLLEKLLEEEKRDDSPPTPSDVDWSKLLDEVWETFKATHKKEYEELEEAEKRGNWEATIAGILVHNLEADLGIHSFTCGINQLSDMTIDQIVASSTGQIEPDSSRRHYRRSVDFSDITDYPTALNLVEEGWVTKVKNQGQCGSCYAFASEGSLEAMHFLNTGELRDISVQNMLDCGSRLGCGGGWPGTVYNWIQDTEKGIDGWDCYGRDYQAKVESDCLWKTGSCNVTTLTGHNYITAGDEIALQKGLATVGPVAVSIHVGGKFGSYKSGVYDADDCDKPINHGVLLVGYGTEDGKDYWLVKNSWGSWWGDKGFIKMARGKNMCRIAKWGMYPYL